jgi:hypothetical protein
MNVKMQMRYRCLDCILTKPVMQLGGKKPDEMQIEWQEEIDDFLKIRKFVMASVVD